MTTWTLVLPYTAPPLSLNRRLHWAAEKRVKDDLRDAVILLAKAHKVYRCQRIAVELHWRPANNRKRDEDNLTATHKVCQDALVKAGCVPDDTPEFVEGRFPVLHSPVAGSPGQVWLLVTDLSETAATEAAS